jgi:hypothetical protein
MLTRHERQRVLTAGVAKTGSGMNATTLIEAMSAS